MTTNADFAPTITTTCTVVVGAGMKRCGDPVVYVHDKNPSLGECAFHAREAGFPFVGDACRSTPSNTRHFRTASTTDEQLLRHDLKLIADMERLCETLDIETPRRRPGTSDILSTEVE